MEYRKAKYEEFIQKLLLKPTLRGSELLHTFLTNETDFTAIASSTVLVGDLGNIYQSVAQKLRKEKGQNLDSFMNTFVLSTGKTKAKLEWGEQVEESLVENDYVLKIPKMINNDVFGDNFGISYVKEKESSCSCLNPHGITESLFYFCKFFFNSLLALAFLSTTFLSFFK